VMGSMGMSGGGSYKELDPAELSVLPDLENLDVYEVFRKHIFGCFIMDYHGVKSLDAIGIDNVMAEADYPHADSTWPNCIKIANEQLATVPLTDEQKYKILRGNAERLFRFTPAAAPKVAR
jgi:predicted TIM-barrel fold metal-dependent hydrolase